MATAAPSLASLQHPLTWLKGFLKQELAPYPGRTAMVARMVLASSVAMIIIMTFQISNGANAAIYALLITRESPRATVQSAVHVLFAMGVSAAYLLISVQVVINNPQLHFLWILGTLFISYYIISVVTEYGTATSFAILVAAAIPLWDRYVSAETNVEDTLRVTLAVFVGVVCAGVVELIFVHTKPGDEIIQPLAERLTAVENWLRCRADSQPAEHASEAVVRFAFLGTSEMRRALFRSGYASNYRSQMNGIVVLVGRLIDLAATRIELKSGATETHKLELRILIANIGGLRDDLVNRRAPQLRVDADIRALAGMPLLQEVAETVALLWQAFAGSQPLDPQLLTEGDPPRAGLFAPAALADPEHLKFALKGCCAAGACYIIYSGVDWQGISTAVTTCLLTALSTIGSSRQKQVLRFGGAVMGGFVIGLGSQIFILPHLDSIFGFTIFFMAVIAFAAWFMTSSPRLSYFGLQIAVAFCLINLQEFAIQTSLAVARDRVVGILLGLFMMWLVFDRLGSAPAISEMKKRFISVLRLLADFEKEPLSQNLRIATERGYSLREIIGGVFSEVRALGDAAVFEFGRDRQQNLALRDAIIRWHSQLRIVFVIRIALWKYRAQLGGFELPKELLAAQQAFDYQLAQRLSDLADRLEGKASAIETEALSADALQQFEQTVRSHASASQSPAARERLDTFLSLYRQTESLLFTLDREIAA